MNVEPATALGLLPRTPRAPGHALGIFQVVVRRCFYGQGLTATRVSGLPLEVCKQGKGGRQHLRGETSGIYSELELEAFLENFGISKKTPSLGKETH